MFWADVPMWISVAVIAATLFAASGLTAAIHVAGRRSGRRTPRPGAVAAALGGWLIASFVLGGAGVFRASAETALPPIIFGIAVPILIGSALLVRLPSLRLLGDAVPPHWAIAAQAARVFGAMFLVLMAQDKLPGEFAHLAGYGDVLVGAAAPVVAYWYLRRRPSSRPVAIGFNVLGLADLVLGVGTGILAAPGALRQIFTAPSTEIMALFPMVLFSLFLVPLVTLIHVFSLRQLLHEASSPEGAVRHRRDRTTGRPPAVPLAGRTSVEHYLPELSSSGEPSSATT